MSFDIPISTFSSFSGKTFGALLFVAWNFCYGSTISLWQYGDDGLTEELYLAVLKKVGSRYSVDQNSDVKAVISIANESREAPTRFRYEIEFNHGATKERVVGWCSNKLIDSCAEDVVMKITAFITKIGDN